MVSGMILFKSCGICYLEKKHVSTLLMMQGWPVFYFKPNKENCSYQRSVQKVHVKLKILK